ncbi:hypothetical protein PG997_002228 [Apiospora hydei]|uniref:N-acetyltransferase domain-containing protein n=1 Tax=Apiospora hydei TaxID=1337664 RepID=A0ABR1X8L7_9PEZI
MKRIRIIQATRDYAPVIQNMVHDAYLLYDPRGGSPFMDSPLGLVDWAKAIERDRWEIWALLVERRNTKVSAPLSRTPLTFHPFPRLPRELKDMIWNIAVEDAKVEELIGCIALHGPTLLDPRNTLNVENVAVATHWQRLGYGRVLAEFAEEVARSRGLAGLDIPSPELSQRDSARIFGFLQAMGFAPARDHARVPAPFIYEKLIRSDETGAYGDPWEGVNEVYPQS